MAHLTVHNEDDALWADNPQGQKQMLSSLRAIRKFCRMVGGPHSGIRGATERICDITETGITRLEKEMAASTCNGKVVEIDGKKYKLKEVR